MGEGEGRLREAHPETTTMSPFYRNPMRDKNKKPLNASAEKKKASGAKTKDHSSNGRAWIEIINAEQFIVLCALSSIFQCSRNQIPLAREGSEKTK